MAHAAWLNLTTKASLPSFLAMATTDRLEDLLALVASGAVRPVVGSTHSFDEAVDAVALVESGHAVGKVVVSVVASHDGEEVAK
jgi:NADPH:quinone reductase-like Zn-dependent oxidoreductase